MGHFPSNQLAWAIATPMTRLVVTTIPMVAVVGTAAVGKSYAAGGLISGSYAAGEAAGAIWLTHKLKQVGIGRELRTICLVGAMLLLVAGAILWFIPSLWLGAALAILVLGAISSPIPGVLRSSATQMTSSSQRILAIDNVVNQTCWVLGPILGVVLVHQTNTVIAYVSLALLLLGAAVVAPLAIPSNYRHESGEGGKVSFRPIAVPVVASGVIMAVTASFDTLVPGLLTHWFGSDEKASFVLALLALGSVVASSVFGIKKSWPRPEVLAMISTVFMIALLATVGSVQSYSILLGVAVLIGVIQAPSMVLRQVIVSDLVSHKRRASAFSLLYAAGGIGYSLAAAVTPWAADMLSARWASAVTAGACFAILGWAVCLQRKQAPFE